MIPFQKFDLTQKEEYLPYLRDAGSRGCEYSLVNLFLWGRQRAAILEGFLVLFTQFDRRSVYPFPVGQGDIRPVLDAIIHDSQKRGILCRLACLSAQDCMLLEELYPGKFCFHPDRNSSDYIYSVDALAELAGRKYQKKRNHLNRFRQEHPDHKLLPITAELLPAVEEMTEQWYRDRALSDPDLDTQLEQRALRRAFAHREELGLEGLALMEDDRVIAMTMGSRLTEDTFDVHFEKALGASDGAYVAIAQAFAQRIREEYPEVRYLNREDDMGLPGLRKAKLSWQPEHLLIKFWAQMLEDDDED